MAWHAPHRDTRLVSGRSRRRLVVSVLIGAVVVLVAIVTAAAFSRPSVTVRQTKPPSDPTPVLPSLTPAPKATKVRRPSAPLVSVHPTRRVVRSDAQCPVDVGTSPLRDVVITFVNDTDPAWRASFDQHSKTLADDTPSDSLDPKRFRTNGELQLNLKALATHASHWVRRVFIVVSSESQYVAAPTASWPFETVVATHDVLCREMQSFVARETPSLPPMPSCDHVLPTFSSSAIELMLPFIPGIDEVFLYSNDDMFLCDQVEPEQLFNCPSRRMRLLDEPVPAIFYELAQKAVAAEVGLHDERPFYQQKLEWNNRLALNLLREAPLGSFAHLPRVLSRSAMQEVLLTFDAQARYTLEGRFRRARDLLPTLLHGELVRHRFSKRVAPVFLYGANSSDDGVAPERGPTPCRCPPAPSYAFLMIKNEADASRFTSVGRGGGGFLTVNDEMTETDPSIRARIISDLLSRVCGL